MPAQPGRRPAAGPAEQREHRHPDGEGEAGEPDPAEQRQRDADDGSVRSCAAGRPGGHEGAVADDEGVGPGDRVRVGGDDPVGDQVAVVGEPGAQRDGEDVAVDRRRPRVDALAAGRRGPARSRHRARRPR